MSKEPWCADCLKEGHWVMGTQADHIEPHNGDIEKFFSGKLQTLCDRHHSIKTRIEQPLRKRRVMGEGA